MSKKKRKPEKKSKTIQRAITLILGLGFAGSTLAIALATVFSQSDSTATHSEAGGDYPTAEEQLQSQIDGFENVLKREPDNSFALQSLAQIHLQTGNTTEAIPVLEKIVEYYPEQKEVAAILQVIKQQEVSQPAEATEESENTEETE